MDLRQLRYAVAVAEHGSLTAAARACFVAQPSLSQAVATLERELGTPLFVRGPRRVRLTAAGEAFVPAARVALRAADAVPEEVAAVRGVVRGRLTLGMLPSLAGAPVTEWIGAFRVRHPGLRVEVVQGEDSRVLVGDVAEGSADVAVVDAAAQPRRVGVDVQAVGRQELVLVAPPGTRLPRSPLPAATLAAQPLVATPVGTSTRDAVESALRDAGATSSVAVETDLRDLLVPLVLAGAGSAVVPRRQADEARRAGAVVRRLHPPVARDLVLVRRAGTPVPALARFLDVVAAAGPPRW